MFMMLSDFFQALRRLTLAANDAADDVEAFRNQLRAGLGYTADAPQALEHKADVGADADAPPTSKSARNGKKQTA